MLRHIVLLELQPDTSDDKVEAIVSGLHDLQGRIDGLTALVAGRDAGLATGNAAVGFTADFDDDDAWRRYQEHPLHRELIADHIAPVLASRTAIQYRW